MCVRAAPYSTCTISGAAPFPREQMRVLVATAVHASRDADDEHALLRMATCGDAAKTSPRAPALGLCFAGAGFQPWGEPRQQQEKTDAQRYDIENRGRSSELAAALGLPPEQG